MHLPECYQVNDSKRKIADRTPTRCGSRVAREGVRVLLLQQQLQDHPAVLRHLDAASRGRCESSVLWLRARQRIALKDNLRAERRWRAASIRRASSSPMCERTTSIWLAIELADLFLDTLPVQCPYDGERCALGRVAGARPVWGNHSRDASRQAYCMRSAFPKSLPAVLMSPKLSRSSSRAIIASSEVPNAA